MRELSNTEIDDISGGVGLIGAAIGGIGGAVYGVASGGGLSGALTYGAIGAMLGATGGIASAAFAGGRYGAGAYWTGRNVAIQTATGLAQDDGDSD